jgi:hypothetical protein
MEMHTLEAHFIVYVLGYNDIFEKRGPFHFLRMQLTYKMTQFEYFRSAFDSVLKELLQQGVGTTKKQGGIKSDDLEDRMWEEGVLRDDSPQKLLDTLVYCFGLNLALRSGKEHRSLRQGMSQLFEAKPAHLLYVESGSKNNSGGLRDRKVTNKTVKIFENVSNPSRCVIQLFKKYMYLRPSNAPTTAFYLQPMKTPTERCWFTCKHIGHNPLSNTVSQYGR